MNETFIQIMDKFNKELQLHVESWAISHDCKKFKMRRIMRTR